MSFTLLIYHKLPAGKLNTLSSAKAAGGSQDTNSTRKEFRLFVFDHKLNKKFLIDSGSVISIVPAAWNRDKAKTASDFKLFAANNTIINTYGQQFLTLSIGLRRDCSWNFTIADVKMPIIGADLLAHHGLLIDLRGKRLIDPITNMSSVAEIGETSVYSVSTLNTTISPLFRNLLAKYVSITKPPTAPQTQADSPVVHHIVTTGPPCAERPRRLTGDKLKAAKEDIQSLLHHGVIRPSSSQWASPIHMVPKAHGGWRTTGDYRSLNKQTVPDRYPLPVIEDLLQRCHGSKIFSTIDLVRAYHQVPVAQEDISKTAVTTPFGLFEFLGMPPGLRNATQTFQRHMDNILRGIDFAACYIDDLIIFSDTIEAHQNHLEAIFKILSENHLTINSSKCRFGQTEVTYLGYKITSQGYSPPEEKVQAIRDFPRPETVSELRRFLGILNYYRRCIPHAAHAQQPLNEYLKDTKKRDKRKIPWTPDSEAAFKLCKDKVASAIRSTFLSPSAPLALSTDASDSAIGAALEQLEDGEWKPLGFFSRKLSLTETRYSTYDRELLAIFAAVKFFRHVLEGRPFIIKTDHRPLVHAFAQRADRASPRQLNQLGFISQFTTEIVHVSGSDNIVADALSRINAIDMPTILSTVDIKSAQETDSELQQLLASKDTSCNLQRLIIENQSIYCDTSTGWIRPYLPTALRRRAFDIVHSAAHPSNRVTIRHLKQKFIWPGMRRDVTRWSRECISCQKCKIQRHNRLQPAFIDVPDNRFDHVHLDIIELPPVNGLRYCLTMIDRFTRWPVAVPLANIEADTVATAFFAHWIAQFGTPLKITTDQGAQFESRLFAALSKMVGATKIRTTPYRPQSNGIIERWHRTVKTALMCNGPTPWPDLLPSVLLGLRVAYKEDLKASPAQLLYGTELRIPGEFFISDDLQSDPNFFLEKFREHIRKVRPTPTAHHTKSRFFILKDLYTCTHVFVRIDAVRKPLDPPYTGPHEIVNRINDRVFIVRIGSTQKAISVDRLKPAFTTKVDTPQQLSSQQDSAASEATAAPPKFLPTYLDPPLRTYSRVPKKVSFSSLPSQSTGRGVDVAAQPKLSQPTTARRRKQELIPRRE